MYFFLTLLAVQRSVHPEEAKSKAEVNPEQFLNISEKILYWGYPAEEYNILTEDGYYLSVNRIPAGSKSAVLLMHGLIVEGSDWVANLLHQSLGFILADAGYDVWIGNNRRTLWSRRHKHLTIDQQEFWNFSFHEMGIYDLSAIVNFILKKTGQKKIYYVSHSQGGTIALVGFSIIPQLADKIKIFFALAPAYSLRYSITPLALVGRLPEPFLKSRSDVYVSIFPDYSSVKNLIHLSQVVKTGKFRYFDYGSKNQEKYNQTSPPFYRLEEITVPVALWSGGRDWVCPAKGVEELVPRVPNLIHYKEFPDWDHWDFIWGIDAYQRLYPEILDLMQKYP